MTGNDFNAVCSVAGRWWQQLQRRPFRRWTLVAHCRVRSESSGQRSREGAEGEPGRGDGRAVIVSRCFRVNAPQLARGAMSWTEDANLLSGTADAVSNDFMN